MCYLVALLITEIIYLVSVKDEWTSMEHWWNDTGRKTEAIREKPVPLPLSTTNPTQAGLGSNLGLRGDTLTTNRPSLDTALSFHVLWNRLQKFKINTNFSSIVFSNHYTDRFHFWP